MLGVALTSWVQLARVPGSATIWNSLWAEDSSVFLTDAYHHGLLHNLFLPHSGYYQVIGRLVAQPAAHMPVSWAAAWLGWSSAVVVSLCGLVVWNRSGQLTERLLTRLMLALLVPLMPQLIFEVTGAANDLHWYLIYTLFWILIAPYRSKRGVVFAVLFVGLASLSDPLTGIMILAGLVGWLLAAAPTDWRWVARWSGEWPGRLGQHRPAGRASWLPVAAMLALVAGEIAQFALHAHLQHVAVSRRELPEIYGLRVALSSLVGDRLVVALYANLGRIVIILGTLAALLIFVGLLLRSGWNRISVIAVTAGVLSVVYLFVPLDLRGDATMLVQPGFTLNNSRYTVLPLWLLFTAFILLADVAPRPSIRLRGRNLDWLGRWPSRSILIGIGVMLLVQSATESSMLTVRSGEQTWTSTVHKATDSCHQPVSKRYRQQLVVVDGVGVGPDDVVILTAPYSPPGKLPFYGVIVSCRRLLKN